MPLSIPFPQNNTHLFLRAHFLPVSFKILPGFTGNCSVQEAPLFCSLVFYAGLSLKITKPEKETTYTSISTCWLISNLSLYQTTPLSYRPIFSLTYWIIPPLCFIDIYKSIYSKSFPSILPSLCMYLSLVNRRNHPQS